MATARLDYKVSVTPIEQTSDGAAGGPVQVDAISFNFQKTLGGGNSSVAWAGSNSPEWVSGVNTHVSSEDTSTIVTSTSDGLWIKHSGFDYDAAQSDNKGSTVNTANLTVKHNNTAITILGPGEGIFIPKPSDTTWKLADDGTPCAVEYAIFT